MTTPLVLTFVGDDRPGLVNAISEKVAASGATWLESRSVRLAGKFAGVVLISVPDDRLTELELSLSDLAHTGLRITIERGAAAEAEKPARIVSLEHPRPRAARHRARRDADAHSPRRQYRGIHRADSRASRSPAPRCFALTRA